MSAEPALIDTNVLVYALFAGSPEHAASLALLESTPAGLPGRRLDQLSWSCMVLV